MAIPNPTAETFRAAMKDIHYVAWVDVSENDFVYYVRWQPKDVMDGIETVIIHKG